MSFLGNLFQTEQNNRNPAATNQGVQASPYAAPVPQAPQTLGAMPQQPVPKVQQIATQPPLATTMPVNPPQRTVQPNIAPVTNTAPTPAPAPSPTPTAPAPAPSTPPAVDPNGWNSFAGQLAQKYSTNPWMLGSFGNYNSNYNNPNALAQFTQQIQGNTGLQALYNKGTTLDQMAGSQDQQDLMQLNAWRAQDHGPEDQMPANLAAFAASDKVQGPTEGGNSDYVLRNGLNAQATPYTPFNNSLYKDPNLVGTDAQSGTGLVTTAANQKTNPIMDAGYFAIPSLMMGGMMGAGMSAAAAGTLTAGGDGLSTMGSFLNPSNLSKIPSLANSMSNNEGGFNATSLINPALQIAGASGIVPQGVSTGLNIANQANNVYNMVRNPTSIPGAAAGQFMSRLPSWLNSTGGP